MALFCKDLQYFVWKSPLGDFFYSLVLFTEIPQRFEFVDQTNMTIGGWYFLSFLELEDSHAKQKCPPRPASTQCGRPAFPSIVDCPNALLPHGLH